MLKRLLVENAPPRNSECLCGSGKKFKKCCLEHYLNVEPESANNFLRHEDYANALVFSRAFLTYYLLLNRFHTQKIAWNFSSENFPLFQIDIEALESALNQTFIALKKNKLENEWPQNLNRLISMTESPRLKELFCCKLSEWYYIYENDKSKAFGVIACFEPATSLSESLIGLHLDLNPNELPFAQKMNLIDRILQLSKSNELSLHYSIIKGISYCLINDIETGKEILKSAIDQYRTKVPNDSQDRFILFKAMLLFYQFEESNTILPDAIKLGKEALETRELDQEFKAELLLNLGDAYHYSENYEMAQEYYQKAYEIDKNVLSQIFIARSLVSRKEFTKAKSVLNSINHKNLSQPNLADFALVWTRLALSAKGQSDVVIAKDHLKNTDFGEPFFVSIQNKLLIEIMDVNSIEDISFWNKLIDFVTRYLHLKPNVFGIGLDFNNILKDLKTNKAVEGREAHKSKEESHKY